MGLSDDQKAILRLLSQRGEQGYEDLSALMGIGVGEVHERAQAAAAELEAEGIPAPAIPPPPGIPAPAASPPPASVPTGKSPEPGPVSTEKKPEPRGEKPADPKPEAEPSTQRPKLSPPTSTGARAAPPKLALPAGTGARAAIGAGAAVIVVVILLLVLGGGDSNDGSDATTTGAETAASEEAANTSGNAKLTQAVLAPVDGSDAKGVATFGRVKNSLALQIEAEGLEPTGKGESYTIWLYQSADKMLPLASTAVGNSGKIGAQVEVPTEVLGYLANEAFDQIDVSLTSNAGLKASLAKATKEKKAPTYTGADVLRGRISGPIIGAAKKANSE